MAHSDGYETSKNLLPDLFIANYEQIGEHLANVDWVGILLKSSSANTMFETFLALLHYVIVSYVPKRKAVFNQLNLPPHLERLHSERSSVESGYSN